MSGRAFCCAVVVFGIVSLAALVPDLTAYAEHDHGNGSYAGQPVASIDFVDQTGKVHSFESLRGRPFVLAFFCVHCAQARICDGVSGKLAYLQGRLPSAYRIVELTFDPANDDRAQRFSYSQRYGAKPDRWFLASGLDDDETQVYAASFGISIEAATPEARHTESLIVVDASGRVAERVSAGQDWDADALVDDARVVGGQSVTPAQAVAFAYRRALNAPPLVRELLFATPAIVYLTWLTIAFARFSARPGTTAYHDVSQLP